MNKESGKTEWACQASLNGQSFQIANLAAQGLDSHVWALGLHLSLHMTLLLQNIQQFYLLAGILLRDKVVEADSLPTSERYSAIIGNVNAIKTEQNVAFLQDLVSWSSRLNTPYKHALLTCLQIM